MSESTVRPVDEAVGPGNKAQSSVKTMVELLRRRAQQQPERRAYTFLLDGERQGAHLTYGELDRQARALAARLQRLGASGERAILLYPPGLDYLAAFFGCLYAGVVAVPSYPPDVRRLQRTLPRFLAMVEDATPQLVLTTGAILQMVGVLRSSYPQLNEPQWLATDAVALQGAAQAALWRGPAVSEDSLAFLQYTSGSTASPRGVMLSHGNLLHNLAQIQQAFGSDAESVAVIWLPAYHDMGLIGGLMQPLYAGLHVILMSPLDFLQKPLRWLQAISRYGATHSGGPNFAYDLCVRKVRPAELAPLDLSQWRVAFNGAEPVRAQTLARFGETFAPCGFRLEAFLPCYGLAEVSVFGTGADWSAGPTFLDVDGTALAQGRVALRPQAEGGQRLVSSGRTWLDQELMIVEPETGAPAAGDAVGEIWLRSASVGQGYWQKPTETAQTFGGRQSARAAAGAGEDSSGDRPWLRTGDLGFVHEGELYVTGRLKDLIIVDGLNHYPQDIEATVEASHPALRPGGSAAFAVEQAGQELVVVTVEVARPARLATLRAEGIGVDGVQVGLAIRRAVAAHHDLRLHEVVLLEPGSVPKTSSGKIQRHACREGYLAGTLEEWLPEEQKWEGDGRPDSGGTGAERDAGERKRG